MQKLRAQTIENGGATINPMTCEAPTSGYMVGGIKELQVPHNSVDPFQDCFDEVLDMLFEAYKIGACVGTWVYEGTLYVDISRNIQDLEEAEKIGRVCGELAIYDVNTGRSLAL